MQRNPQYVIIIFSYRLNASQKIKLENCKVKVNQITLRFQNLNLGPSVIDVSFALGKCVLHMCQKVISSGIAWGSKNSHKVYITTTDS